MCMGVAPACELFITPQIKRSDLPAFTQTLKVTLNHYSPFTYPQNNILAEAMTEEALPLCVCVTTLLLHYMLCYYTCTHWHINTTSMLAS